MHDDNKNTNQKNKLRTYRLLKKNCLYENYLSIVTNAKHRAALTKLRISAHNLEIETGRYKKIPSSSRKCTVCDQNKVEDEMHFLLECKLYENERTQMFKEINLIQCNNTNINKMITMLTNSSS